MMPFRKPELPAVNPAVHAGPSGAKGSATPNPPSLRYGVMKADPSRLSPKGVGGFSLIFMSIFILAMAMIMVAVLPDVRNDNARTIDDIDKLNTVEEHMRSFMAFNGRRPCPADGQYPDTSKYFGQEAGTPGTCQGNASPTPNAPLGPDSSGNIVAGVIPTRNLGLDASYAYDSYGRHFTYVVDKRATKLSSCESLENWPNANGKGGITIDDAAGNTIDQVMYAYIQHGPSGYGAWPGDGSPTALSAAQSAARRVNSGSTDLAMQIDAWVDVAGSPPGVSTFTPTPSSMLVKNGLITPYTTGGKLDTGFSDLVWYRDDLKNTCCLGPWCNMRALTFIGTHLWNDTVATAMGDINGDGKKDMVISSTNYGCDNTYVVFGKSSGWTTPNSMTYGASNYLNGATGFHISAPTGVGGCTMAVGDVNGDHYDDIGFTDTVVSTTYIVFGKSDWSASGDYNVTSMVDGTHGISITMPNSTTVLKAIGDFDGDGFADLVFANQFANSNTGAVYIVWGKSPADWAAGGATYTLTGAGGLIDGTRGIEIDGPAANYYTGYSISAADLNKDGKADLIIVADQTDPTTGTKHFTGGVNGYTYVLFGSARINWTASPYTFNTGAGQLIDGTKGFRLDGCTGSKMQNGYLCSNGLANISHTAVADVNGDGLPDIVGTSFEYGPDWHTDTYVIFGRSDWSSSPNWSLDKGGPIINGTNGFMTHWKYQGDGYEYYVSAGDINGDGYADIFITGIAAHDNPTNGSIYVINGAPTSAWSAVDYTLDAGGKLINGVNGFRLDYSYGPTGTLSAVFTGDINGDGLNDFFTSSPYLLPTNYYGYSYLFFGGKHVLGGRVAPAVRNLDYMAGD